MTLHTKVSYAKSVVRLIGYFALLWCIPAAVFLLVFAECLGIAEEAWPGAYEGTEIKSNNP